LATKKIPNKLNLLGLSVVLLFLVSGQIPFTEAIYVSSITFLSFLLLYVFGIFGAGDVKLMGVAAAPVPLILLTEFVFLSCLFAAATGLILVILRGDGKHIWSALRGIFLKINSFTRRVLSGFSNKSILTDSKSGAHSKNDSCSHETNGETDQSSVSVDLKTPFAQGVFLASLWMFGGSVMSLI